MRRHTTASSWHWIVAVVVVGLLLEGHPLRSCGCHAWSSRRTWLIKAPVGAALTYVYGRGFSNVLQNVGLKHPAAHEERVQSTIAKTLQAAGHHPNTQQRHWNILEVGMGTECRIIRRGLYRQGLQELQMATTTITSNENSRRDIPSISLVGVDLQAPDDTTLNNARRILAQESDMQIDLSFLSHSITEPLPFDDGTFDAIICCLTLCSVDDPAAAVQEMNRLLRPDGGTLGFVEHVAVNPDERDRLGFLERQQVWLDPWQQKVADNCHLHRYTQDTFQTYLTDCELLQQERFVVDAMWPVSMQACGVYQKQKS